MAFDPSSIVHTQNRWFQAKVAYRGEGIAEFSNPACSAQGIASATFNEVGRHTASINVNTFDPDNESSIYVPGFQMGVMPLEGDFNPCTKLTIDTGAGRFVATRKVGISKSEYSPRPRKLHFHFLRSAFEVKSGSAVRYWVLPLANFVSPAFAPLARPGASEFAKHPLRIYPTPDMPSEISPEDEFDVFFEVHRKNRLIGVKLPHGLAFIEALPDYANRVSRLERGTTRSTVTSVMVGDVGGRNFDADDSETWFPLDILNLLSLATGVRVGAPWLEFRDADGKLVRRDHMSFGQPTFERGHEVMPEYIYPNTGYLLSKALASSQISNRYLRVLLTHLTSACRRNRSIEDRFLSVCRGYETLANHYGIFNQNLAEALDHSQQDGIANALDEAAKQIDNLRALETDRVRKTILNRITDRVRGAASKESLFGLKVAAILQRFALPDSLIMQEHFKKHARNSESWEGLISMYRGAAIHEGAFDIGGGKHDVLDISRVLDHLLDGLLRVFFKEIGYDGQYHSPIVPIFRLSEVDWVKADSPPSQLGYPE
jgi:hypothetical protein